MKTEVILTKEELDTLVSTGVIEKNNTRITVEPQSSLELFQEVKEKLGLSDITESQQKIIETWIRIAKEYEPKSTSELADKIAADMTEASKLWGRAYGSIKEEGIKDILNKSIVY